MPAGSRAARHLAKIVESEQLGHAGAHCSTTEGIMVAIALCDRRYLPSYFEEKHVRELRSHLDVDQLAAIEEYSRTLGLHAR